MTPKHILIIVSDFPKVTETFALLNALHYSEAGHPVSIFHLKPFRDAELVHDHARPIIEQGFTFGWLDGQSLRGLIWALSRPRALFGALGHIARAFWTEPKRLMASLALVPKTCAMARRAQETGVDHIHAEFAGYPATSAWVTSQLTGIPFSFSAHAHDIFLTQNLLSHKAQHAEFVRSISNFNIDFLSALSDFPADKLRLLRCGVKLMDDVPLPAGPTGQIPLRILFVGALLPRKGVDVLLHACAGLSARINWQLDVIGDGSQRDMLQELVHTLGLNRVTFLGSKTSQDVRTAMQAAHLVVVPSRMGDGGRSEGIPVVLMEALSLSRPVISTQLSGIPELVEHGVTGLLCPPDDPNSISQAIEQVYDDYAEAARLGAAGRDRIAAEYDISKTAEALRQHIIGAPQT